MKFSAASIVSLAVVMVSMSVQAHELPSRYALARRGNQFVTGPCKADSDCQQGCCAFSTGKCAGPGIAQTNGDGGCGFGNTAPNCDVATALNLNTCVAGAQNGDITSAAVQSAAKFTANLDNLPFTPASSSSSSSSSSSKGSDNAAAASPASSAAASTSTTLGSATVFETCSADSECQQGCCGFSSGKCAGPAVAQTNGSGGCGHGNTSPNCNVAAALGLSECIAGAKNGDLSNPLIQAQAKFVSQLDGLPFTPQ